MALDFSGFWFVIALFTFCSESQWKTDKGLPWCTKTNITDGKILTSDCYGVAVVSTMDKTATVTCESLSKIVVHGPVLINFTFCQIIGVGIPVCHPGPESDLFGIPQCDHPHDDTVAILWTVLILSTVINISACRAIWVRFKFVPSGFLCLYRTKGWFNYSIVAKKNTKEGLVFDCKKEEVLQEETSYLRETFVITWKIFILIMLVLPTVSLVPTSEAALVNEAEKLFSHSLFVSESDRLRVEGATISITDAYYRLNWASAYKTAPYIGRLSSDWHCTSVCWKGEYSCYQIGPHGKWSKNCSWTTVEGKAVMKFKVDYCMPGTTGCFIRPGCWKWEVTFDVEASEMVEVMTLTSFEPVLKYHVQDLALLKGLDINMQDLVPWNHECLVKAGNNKWLVCDQCSFREHPEAGKIGEIQIASMATAVLSHELSSCQKDSYGGPICSIQDSSLGRHLSTCKPVRYAQSAEGFMMRDKEIIYKKQGSVTVKFLSKEEHHSYNQSQHCGGTEMHLWAIEHSGVPATLVITSRFIRIDETTQAKIPCEDREVIVNCDKIGVTVQVPWPSPCLESRTDIIQHVSDSELVDPRESHTLHYVDSNTGVSFSLGDFMSGFHLPGLMSLFGINAIIVVVVLFVVCKK